MVPPVLEGMLDMVWYGDMECVHIYVYVGIMIAVLSLWW